MTSALGLSLTFFSEMEHFGGLGFSDVSSAVRKKRSNAPRRPRSESQPHLELPDISSLSSTPPSENNLVNMEDGSYGESDEASNNGSFQDSNEKRHRGIDSRRHTEGVLAPANWRSTSNIGSSGVISSGLENERKVKKVKLKVGGVTHTIDAKSVSDGASGVGSSSTRSSHFPGFPHKVQKSTVEDNSDDLSSFPSEKDSGLQRIPWKDSQRGGLNAGKAHSSRTSMPDEIILGKQTDRYEPLRKSKRVPKRRLLEGVLDDGDDDVDDEIRYLEKVKTSRAASDYSEENENGGRKHRKVSKRNIDDLYDNDVGDYGSMGLKKDGKKSRSGRISEDTDYVEDEEPVSDVEPENRRKKARKEVVDLLGNSRKEMTVTTRKRAQQTGTDILLGFAVNQVEFPDALPPAPPKKQKEKLSEVEQQLKKAEAAQRRRMQVEKAARESEAEAIRRILGQDSTRKKREDKMKKKQEESAQEKAANAMILASDSVRWVMGPSGTVVTFPDEVGLPSIFDSKPCSYPPPREKCAGPSCSNPYKYRDSKSKLPLCSLHCYKAIREKMPSISAC